MNQYEAMFLFDPTFGSSFEKCETEIRRLMQRAEGELLFCRRWEERRLAYRIRGRKRGVYVLTYFKAKPDKITPLERDAELSENILRLLVLRADDVTPEYMEQMVPTRTAEAPRPTTDDTSAPPPEKETQPEITPKEEVDLKKESEVVTSESAVADASAEEIATDDL